MLTNFKVITVTHHYVDIKKIEGYVVRDVEDKSVADFLRETKNALGIKELVYLATCNRVTFILYGSNEIDLPYLRKFFGTACPAMQDHTKIDFDHVSAYEGLEAIRHILEVSGSIDSLVVGEREIFRQMREAFSFARENNLVGDNMRMLENVLVSTSKSIYANTRIGEKPLSIASLAVENLIACGANTQQKAILVGAGETNTLVGKFMIKHGFSNIDVFNRSIDNARKLSEITGGQPYLISDINGQTHNVEIIMVCTGAKKPVITKEVYEKISQSDEKVRTIVDLSVPANVSKEVREHQYVNYISIEELRLLAAKNLDFRRREITLAKKIVSNKLQEFRSTYEQRKLEIALKDVPTEIKQIKSKAVDVVYKKRLDQLDDTAKTLLLEMMEYMEKKCISIPMKAAKNALK